MQTDGGNEARERALTLPSPEAMARPHNALTWVLVLASVCIAAAHATSDDAAVAPPFPEPAAVDALATEGRAHLVAMEEKAQQHKGSGGIALMQWLAGENCWAKALADTRASCPRLGLEGSHEEEAMLALRFSNCHLGESGMRRYPCSRGSSIEKCTKKMDDKAFLVYTSFRTQVSSICAHLLKQSYARYTRAIQSQMLDSMQVSAGMARAMSGSLQSLGELQTNISRDTRTLLQDTGYIKAATDASLENERALLRLQAEALHAGEDAQRVVATLKESTERVAQQQRDVISQLDIVQDVAARSWDSIARIQRTFAFASSAHAAGLMWYILLAAIIYITSLDARGIQVRRSLLGLGMLQLISEVGVRWIAASSSLDVRLDPSAMNAMRATGFALIFRAAYVLRRKIARKEGERERRLEALELAMSQVSSDVQTILTLVQTLHQRIHEQQHQQRQVQQMQTQTHAPGHKRPAGSTRRARRKC